MEKSYDPKQIENTIYQQWESKNYFKPSNRGAAYSIVLPPPNITGYLHMGHGFQHTLMDALIRYHRMKGYNTLWQPGTDHAGIATQMVVERQLAAEEKTRHDIGRDSFVERVWKWKENSGDTIVKQMRRIGDSVDWSRERFTMDEGLSNAVNKAFIDLYKNGLIYRGKRLVNWDPVLHTAISNLEVNNGEEDGFFWIIKYPFADQSGYMLIATTRPETMLGDTAIAVHPNDERYQAFIGKEVQLPLTDRTIPIIADDYVDPEFGTGCVKITPAHDFNDYEVGQRHDLPFINILTKDARINENAPKKYQGLDRFEARKQIVHDLNALNLLEKIEPRRIKVPRGDRSHAIIEPWLTDQWFLNVKPLAKTAIQAVESGKIKFIPDTWTTTYSQWMHNIEDWCISRQLWWGHRIPAWYDDAGNIYVGETESAVRKQHKLSGDIKLTQDTDVLDTWFSSASWPFSTMGWPDTTDELKTFYPTRVLVTGFDIIFFWVARMIMFGLHFMQDIPFHEIYITGLIRDHEGKKMSKSKGNVLDPIDLIDGIDLKTLTEKRTFGLMQPEMKQKIEKNTQKEFPHGISGYGADALRMTFCALASTSRDICFDIGRLEGYRNFCNKLWNATRYVLMNTDNKTWDEKNLSTIDHWILSRLQATIAASHEHFKNYRFDLLAQTLHEFAWHEFCDWYLELSKTILLGDDEDKKSGARYTLIHVLDQLLRLLHPIMPFVTEHLWQQIAPQLNKTNETIMLQPYPEIDERWIDVNAEKEIEWVKSFIISIRNIRGEINIPPGKKIGLLIQHAAPQDKQLLKKHEDCLFMLAKLEAVQLLNEKEKVPESASALMNEMQLHIPLAGLMDKKAEIARLEKEIQKNEKELAGLQKRLDNPRFAEKAPQDIIEKAHVQLITLQNTLETLQARLKGLK
ncbi:MAG: valine--tRNA ligase [Pseudomonadota bacterium]